MVHSKPYIAAGYSGSFSSNWHLIPPTPRLKPFCQVEGEAGSVGITYTLQNLNVANSLAYLLQQRNGGENETHLQLLSLAPSVVFITSIDERVPKSGSSTSFCPIAITLQVGLE